MSFISTKSRTIIVMIVGDYNDNDNSLMVIMRLNNANNICKTSEEKYEHDKDHNRNVDRNNNDNDINSSDNKSDNSNNKIRKYISLNLLSSSLSSSFPPLGHTIGKRIQESSSP